MTDEDLSAALRLLEDPDLSNRCEGVARLRALPGAAATAALALLLEESSWYLRDRVVEALESRPRADDEILRVLREGAWYARASACDALGRRGEASAVPEILGQLEDRNVSVQKSAVRALERIAASHGEAAVARPVAALPSDRRGRATARIGHQAPHWADAFTRSLRELPESAFGPTAEERPSPSAVRGSDREHRIARFRRWLGGLPPEAEGS